MVQPVSIFRYWVYSEAVGFAQFFWLKPPLNCRVGSYPCSSG
jgi:hypothetical protein